MTEPSHAELARVVRDHSGRLAASLMHLVAGPVKAAEFVAIPDLSESDTAYLASYFLAGIRRASAAEASRSLSAPAQVKVAQPRRRLRSASASGSVASGRPGASSSRRVRQATARAGP